MLENNDIVASIIVPVYNVEQYLKECLDSIFVHQKISYPIEVIVVNDGSDDGSLNFLNEYKKEHYFILINQENKGLSIARNTGIKASNGKYLLFMDSDDYFVPNALDKLLKYLSDNNIDLVEFNYDTDNETEKHVRHKKRITNVVSGSGQDVFCAWGNSGFYRPNVWTRAVTREMVVSNELYFYPGIYYEDGEWSPKLFAYAKTAIYLPIDVYVYRIREGSITSEKTKKHYLDLITIVDSLYKFACDGDFSVDYTNALMRNISFFYFYSIRGIKITGEYNQYMISFLEKNRKFANYSTQIHRKYLYKWVIYRFGIKRFYKFKYGLSNFLK